MSTIPQAYRDLLDKVVIVHLATLMPDGSPHVSPVWFEYVGDHVRVNSAAGRQKDRNMRRDPRVALSIDDPQRSGRELHMRGKVVGITTDGALEHIDALARRYSGKAWIPVPGQRRVIYEIQIEHASGSG
jgi:PPOX class probable F420-dependent enzyme